MRRRGPAFQVPNALLVDRELSFTARVVGAAIYSRKNSLNTCRKSIEELAALCHFSVGTVQTCLKKLEERGYLSAEKNYRFHLDRNRRVYAKTAYTCAPVTKGFTLIPRSVFQYQLKPSRFLVLLYLYYQTGNAEKAFPSLSYMARHLKMSRGTVNDSIRELDAVGILYAQHCINANGSFNRNSYFFLCQTTGAAMRTTAPGPVRPRVRHMAANRLGVILARRRRPLPPGSGILFFPYGSFRPIPQRWKPPFTWG